MKVTYLYLRGIGRFHNANLPISELTNDDRLIAVVGKNGEGKSTMLGCVPGAIYHYLPGYGAINQMATGKDSSITLGLEVESKAIEIELLVNGDAKPIKQQAYLSVDGKQLIPTGKVTDFKAKIAEILPSRETYLVSRFSAQNKEGRVLKLPPAERKALFARMLNLGKLQQLTELAKNKASVMERRRECLLDSIETIKKEADDPLVVGLDLDKAASEYEEVQIEVARLEDLKKGEVEIFSAWLDKKQQLETARIESKLQLEQAYAQNESNLKNIEHLESLAAKTRVQKSAYDAARQDLSKIETWLITKLDYENQVDRNIESLKNAQQEMSDSKQAQLQWYQAKQRIDNELNVIDQMRTYNECKARRDVDESKRILDEVHNKHTFILQDLPCREAGDYSQCPLFKRSSKEQESVPSLLENYNTALLELHKLKNISSEKAKKIDELDRLGLLPAVFDKRVEELSRLVAEDEVRMTQIHETKVQQVILEERIETLSQAISDSNVSTQAINQAKLKLKNDQNTTVRLYEMYDEAGDKFAEHNTAKPVLLTSDLLLEAKRIEGVKAIAYGSLTARLDRAKKDLESIQGLTEGLTSVVFDLDDWTELARVLGPNGVQALLIDAAGPEVSDLANELLSECYSDRFVLQLTTTRPRADGKGSREVFDLTVTDNDRGRVGTAEKYSGGEQVIIDEAIALAIAIYNARKGGISGGDLFRDECSGTLDNDKAPRYISMLRKALTLGGFSRCYFITHQDFLVDLADKTIVCNNGNCY
jgi:exonuclease SbcC